MEYWLVDLGHRWLGDNLVCFLGILLGLLLLEAGGAHEVCTVSTVKWLAVAAEYSLFLVILWIHCLFVFVDFESSD